MIIECSKITRKPKNNIKQTNIQKKTYKIQEKSKITSSFHSQVTSSQVSLVKTIFLLTFLEKVHPIDLIIPLPYVLLWNQVNHITEHQNCTGHDWVMHKPWSCHTAKMEIGWWHGEVGDPLNLEKDSWFSELPSNWMLINIEAEHWTGTWLPHLLVWTSHGPGFESSRDLPHQIVGVATDKAPEWLSDK